MSKRIVVLVALAVGALSACIIGPKQDDPAPSSLEQDSGVNLGMDTSGAADKDAAEMPADSTIPPPADTLAPDTTASSDVGSSDAGCAPDADGGDACASDAAPDAVTDAVTDAADGG